MTPWVAWTVAGGFLLLLFLLVLLYIRRRRAVARALGEPAVVQRLIGVDLHRAPAARLALLASAAIAISLALLVPGQGAGADPRVGTGVVLAIDASTSMSVADVQPTRLEVARQVASALVAGAPDQPFGIVAFAGRGYTLTPPTSDRSAINLYLATIDPSIVTQTGSSMAGAIRQSLALIGSSGGAIVLITDGEALNGEAPEDPAEIRAALDLARRGRVPVHTLGVGSASGGPVSIQDAETGRVDVVRNPAGEPVLSTLDEPLLREIASETGGVYALVARPGDAAAVARRLETLTVDSATPPARFAWFAVAAVLLLLLEGAVQWRERKP